MELQEFINKAYATQNDAGSLNDFTGKVTNAMETCGDNSINDPVAAFLGALIADNDGDIDAARRAIDFWADELSRVVKAVFLDD